MTPSRRTFLATAGAAVATALTGGISRAAPRTISTWDPVPAVDLSELSPDQFADDEVGLPFYLAHLHQVANAVVEEGEHRGFIDIHVWRGPGQQTPDNIRIMESILSLAYFYVTDRPWNVYRHSEPLKQRLEAALTFWVNAQDENGMFPYEGGTDFGGRYLSGTYANTAFVTKFMGETLMMLRADGTLDQALYDAVLAGQRASLFYLLTEDEWYNFVTQYSNQYSNVWAGALSYLNLQDDAELEPHLIERLQESPGHFQSPVGYMYEGHAVDWRYTLTTHLSNVRMARHYALGLDHEHDYIRLLDDEHAAWTDFLAYNALLEPDGGFILNRAVETRQRLKYIDRVPEPGAEVVPLARALAPSVTEIADKYARERMELQRTWPEVDPLPIGEFDAYAPYVFLHRNHVRWYPTDAQRQQAVASLPYLVRDSFTHQRADTRVPIVFTYVRRPTYYAAINTGERTRGQQRLGLGVLWNEELGAVLQSQTGGNEQGAWGTRVGAAVYEAGDLTAAFFLNGEFVPELGVNKDLPTGLLRIVYDLGAQGRKRVHFGGRDVAVHVAHAGTFNEDIPVVYYEDRDELILAPDLVTLRRNGATFVIRVEGATSVDLLTTDTYIWDEPPVPNQPLPFETVNRKAGDPSIGDKKLATIRFTATEDLTYRMSFIS